MHIKLNSTSRSRLTRYTRLILLCTLITTLAASIYFGSDIRQQNLGYYVPGRAAIINARLWLEDSLAHERALIEQHRKAHEEISHVISQLAEAKNLDPSEQYRIENMQARLLQIERENSRGNTNLDELQQQYQTLLKQMDSLISRMETHTS
jgi:hypothetical protein